MMRVLLLNPPGAKLYIRDYYCSKVSKSNYLFPPIDLLMLSGRLAERYDVQVIDAIADGLAIDTCLRMIEDIAPEIIISLVGSVSSESDYPFLKRIRNLTEHLLVSGDITRENTLAWLARHDYIDAVITDFTSPDIIRYLEGTPNQAPTIIARDSREPRTASRLPSKNDSFDLPLPRHELFTSQQYRFPFVKHKKFAVMLTDYGCPYSCTFCVMSTLRFRFRPVENVIEEMKHLKRLGKKEIFFADQTFGVQEKRLSDLCKQISEEGFNFGWVCYSRVDVLNETKLRAMKAAGCHTIIFGVESGSEFILKTYRKGYTKQQIRGIFKLCGQIGIRTVATFIIGLPEETEATATDTLDFLKEIDCDFASFNVAVPRHSTLLRKHSIAEHMVDKDLEVMDQSGTSICMPTRHLGRDEVLKLKRKMTRTFYLRPGYLLKRLINISSFYELKEHIHEAYAMFKGL